MSCFGFVIFARRRTADYARQQQKPTPISAPELGAIPKNRDGAVKLYDQWALGYDDALRSWEYPAPGRTAELLRSYCENGMGDQSPVLTALSHGGLPVLDAGCGTGLSGEALIAAGFTNLLGSDVSQASLDLCKSKGFYKILFNSDLESKMPLEDDSVGGLTCVGVLAYVQRFHDVFNEWCRIIAPGGLVVFTHIAQLWDGDVDSVATAAKSCAWKQIFMSDHEPYMPRNPDPKESAKMIRYLVFQVL